MNSKVHPLVVMIVLVFTVLTIAVWMWSTGQAKEVGGPSGMTVAPSGHLYVQMQNYLLEHDTSGRFVKRHDLTELGVERLLGAVRFFSNGDILLRSGPDTQTLLDNIRAYMRLENKKPLHSNVAEAGLFRCNLGTGSCELFGTEAVDFAASFGLFIDWTNDDVYISDTSRHTIRKYSAQGESLGSSEDGWYFPNQLTLHQGRLYVANTNHHSVRIIQPATDSFGADVDSVDVVPDEARSNGQRWPSHFARVGAEWWVNNMRTNMAEGGIYIFDSDWDFKYSVDLPEGADPISLVNFGDEILVSDWNNDRVYRVAPNGQVLGEFESHGLQDLVTESVAIRWQYQAYAYLAVFVFALLIAALLIKGVLSEVTQKTAPQAKRAEAPSETPLEFSDELIWIRPDPKIVRKLKLSMRLAGFLVVCAILIFAYFVTAFDKQLPVIDLILPFVGVLFIFVLISRMNHATVNTAIGLRGKYITLRSHTGQEVTVSTENIIYDRTTIAAPTAVISLGQPQMAVYDREVLDNELFPRLADATSVSAWEMQKALIRMRHPQGLIAVLAIIALLASGIWTVVKNMIL